MSGIKFFFFLFLWELLCLGTRERVRASTQWRQEWPKALSLGSSDNSCSYCCQYSKSAPTPATQRIFCSDLRQMNNTREGKVVVFPTNSSAEFNNLKRLIPESLSCISLSSSSSLITQQVATRESSGPSTRTRSLLSRRFQIEGETLIL